jgi:TIR domain/FHA domain
MLFGYAKYMIGGAPTADILIEDGTISRRHAMLIALPDGRFQLIDLHTRNGTWVRIKGTFVSIDHSPPLALDDVVRIGSYETTIGELAEMQKRRADIFISYSHPDRDKARVIAVGLARHGWQVWWDERLPLAQDFDAVIEEQVRQCRCALVLWSASAVTSRWVRAEAGLALERNVLVSVFIERVEAPLVFRHNQGHQLTEWLGNTPVGMDDLQERLTGVIGEPKSKPPADIIALTGAPGLASRSNA